MAKLNQIIAIEKGIKSRDYGALTEIHKTTHKPDPFTGLARVYVPKNDDGEKLPPEAKHVQLRYSEVLEKIQHHMTELMDIQSRREWTNTVARATVEIDGTPILRDVPVGYLLFLEKQLTDLRTMFSVKEGMAILDEGEQWKHEASSGLHVTDTLITHRTKKVQKALTLLAPTEHHPGQAVQITEDEIVGYWHTTKKSGAIPRTEKEKIAARVEKLLQAVKQAREAANSVDEVNVARPGQLIFNYLYGS